MAAAVTPPPGFVLENSVPPPPGFVLEGQEPSVFDRVGNMLTGKGGSTPATATEIAQQKNDPTGLQRGTAALVDNLPLIAGTAASLAAPPLALPAWAARLAFASKAAAPFIKASPQIAAAGAGGYAGGIEKEILQNPNATHQSVGQSGLSSAGDMAAGQTLGTGVVAGLSKILKPLFGNEIGQLAKENKIPLSPSAVTPSNVSKVIEGGADAFLPSRLVNDHYRKAAITQFNSLMTKIPEEVGQLKGNQEITQEALAAFKNIFESKGEGAKKLAGQFLESVGKDTEIALDKTLPLLRQIKTNAVDDKIINFVEKKIGSISETGSLKAQDLETMLRQIGAVKPKTDAKFLQQLRESIKADFSSAGADASMLTESNQLFKENIGLLAGQTAKELKAAAIKGFAPPSMTVKIFRNGNEGFVKSLAKEMPEQTWNDLRAQNLSNMLENASTESKRLFGLRIIDGQKLEKILDNNKSVLNAAYKDNPKTIEAMYNIAKLAKAARTDMAKYEQGISSDLKMGNVAALGGMLLHDPVGLVLGSGGSALLAKSLMNPSGLMKQWLTTGVNVSKPVSEGLKLGGRAVFSGDDQDSLPAQ